MVVIFYFELWQRLNLKKVIEYRGEEKKADQIHGLYRNKTKWPRQVRELILDSDSEILDFCSFDKKKRIYSAYFAYSVYSAYSA